MKAALALLLLLLASPASAAPRISSLRVHLDGDRVLADLSLEGALEDKLRKSIESGLPTSILYRFELHRDRKRWYDRRLEANTLETTAVYDGVARTYTIHFRLGDKLIESRMVKDRQELEAAMTRIAGLPVFTLKPAAGRPRLLVKARAELGSRMILSLIPATLATDWVESAKFRPPRLP